LISRAEWLTLIRSGGQGQLTTTHWGSPINDPDDFFYMCLRTGARYTFSGSGRAELDELIDAARSTIDLGSRIALYRRIQEVALDQLPIIPSIVPDVFRGYTNRLRGFVPLRNAQLKTLREVWLAE
jgi:ABC-type transport system substrate-binding protein